MRLLTTLSALSILALSAPQAVSAGEIVEFSLNENELNSPESRQVLLERMTRFSTSSCKSTSVLVTRSAVKGCADELLKQFVKEIDHDALSLLAGVRTNDAYRSASR